MARARDVLLDFCGAICVAVLAGGRPQQNMMPPALETCAWNHVLDAVMRWALCSFPDFIRALTDIKRSPESGWLTSFVFFCRAGLRSRGADDHRGPVSIFCPVPLGHVGELVRLWATCSHSFQYRSTRCHASSDAGPACATISCESQVHPPTRVCHLAVGMVEGFAEM